MLEVFIPVATTQVDARERSAFSPACIDDAERQLNAASVPVTYEYRRNSIAGRTLPASAYKDGNCLLVRAELAAPWWSGEQLEKVLKAGLGGGCAGRIVRESNLYGIHLVEQIEVTEVTLLQLHAGVAQRRITRAP